MSSRHRVGLAAVATLLSFSAQTDALAGIRLAEVDPMKPGVHEVESKEYRLEPTTDAEILDDRVTEIWARVFFPKDLMKGPFPLVAFLHGNHGTCGYGSNPRDDASLEYTDSGVCPEGWVVTPNHEGYNYIASHLASHGYIVFSINANRGITAGRGVEGDWGLNLARGRLVLRHLQYWHQWSTQGGAPESLGIGAEGWIGKVALNHVGLMGHSRGGEGVRAALNQYQDAGSPWPTRIPGLNIEAIFEVGAVDGQTDRVLNAPKVAWNQLIPVCDGDVSTFEGINPFNRMLLDSSEPKTAQKSVTLVYGANHNFFNSEWQSNDSTSFGCQNQIPLFSADEFGSEKQRTVATALMSHFFLANVGPAKNPALNSLFNSGKLLREDLLAITRVGRDYSLSPSEALQLRFDDFSEVDDARVSEWKHSENLTVLRTEAFDSTQSLLSVEWSAGQVAELSLERKTALDATLARTLDFRMSLPSLAKLDAGMDFTVSLIDEAGVRSNAVSPANYLKQDVNPFYSWLFETVRIPLSDFTGVDLKTVKSIHFGFDPKTAGALGLANIRFSNLLALEDAEKSVVAPGEGPACTPDTPVQNPGLPGKLSRLFSRIRKNRVFQSRSSRGESESAVVEASSATVSAAHPQPVVIEGERTRMLGIRETSLATQWSSQYTRRGSRRFAEVVFASDVKFPIRDSLPVLTIGTHQLKLSSIAPRAREGRITFALPEKLRNSLRGQKLPVKLHYKGQERHVWDFGVQQF